MKRITLLHGKRDFIHRIYADEGIEVYIVDPNAQHDRVYR